MRTLAFLLVSCIAAAQTPEGVKVAADIPYREGAEPRWRLDVVYPAAGAAALPGLVVVHGGGWRGGDKRGFRQMAVDYARKGYVVITPNYRLSGTAPFPAAVEDVKCAVRWFRAHARQYGLNPNRIGAFGNSAGAHLVALLGLAGKQAGLEGDGPYQEHSSALQAVVASAAPTDFNHWDPEFSSRRTAVLPFLAGPSESLAERARRASPITYANADAPPMLLIHGTADKTVPFDQAQRLAKALKSAGAKHLEVLFVEGAGHNVFREHASRTEPAMEAFLARHLMRK